jgi:hypothetical protein
MAQRSSFERRRDGHDTPDREHAVGLRDLPSSTTGTRGSLQMQPHVGRNRLYMLTTSGFRFFSAGMLA